MSSSPERNETVKSSEFQQNLDILRQISFFSGLPLDSLKVFAFLCFRETFQPGDYLFRQGDDDGQAFYIISGAANLVFEDNGQECSIREFTKDSFIGGLALLGNMTRLFSLKAVDEVRAMILTREKFNSTINQFPDQMPRIAKQVVESINAWEERSLQDRESECQACRHKIGVSLI
ncbi:MAG: cyclic nucleotide-binding domain-containing protein [Pseudomonadota bacterium]